MKIKISVLLPLVFCNYLSAQTPVVKTTTTHTTFFYESRGAVPGKTIFVKEFDRQGNVTATRQIKSDSTLKSLKTFTYNDEGKLLEEFYMNYEDDKGHLRLFKYNEFGKLEEKIRKNIDEGDTVTYRDYFVYDKEQRLIQSGYFHLPDQSRYNIEVPAEIHFDSIVYMHEPGKIIELKFYVFNGTKLKSKTVEHFDDDGNLLLKEFFKKEKKVGYNRYKYDSENRLINLQKYAGDQLRKEEIKEFDRRGNLEREVFLRYDKSGLPKSEIIKEYHDNGEILNKQWMNYEAGKVKKSETISFEYEFNTHGNWIIMRQYDADRVLKKELNRTITYFK